MPEDVVVCCFQCKLFQGQQVFVILSVTIQMNKQRKFKCKVCGEKQSFRHVVEFACFEIDLCKKWLPKGYPGCCTAIKQEERRAGRTSPRCGKWRVPCATKRGSSDRKQVESVLGCSLSISSLSGRSQQNLRRRRSTTIHGLLQIPRCYFLPELQGRKGRQDSRSKEDMQRRSGNMMFQSHWSNWNHTSSWTMKSFQNLVVSMEWRIERRMEFSARMIHTNHTISRIHTSHTTSRILTNHTTSVTLSIPLARPKIPLHHSIGTMLWSLLVPSRPQHYQRKRRTNKDRERSQ